MEQSDIQSRFIALWKEVGPQWGISKTTAQVHALLLTSDVPLTMDEVMTRLAISRGNASMTLRELQDWQLVSRIPSLKGKKDTFVAEKTAWKISQAVTTVRRKRELDPLITTLSTLKHDAAQIPNISPELLETITSITTVAKRSGKLLELVTKLNQSMFFKPIATFFKPRHHATIQKEPMPLGTLIK